MPVFALNMKEGVLNQKSLFYNEHILLTSKLLQRPKDVKHWKMLRPSEWKDKTYFWMPMIFRLIWERKRQN